MKYSLVIAAFLLTGLAHADTSWPPLNKYCVVLGRAATPQDVADNCAVFAARKLADRNAIKQMNIALPQYAYYNEPNLKRSIPVVVVQAEERNGVQVLGYRDIATGAKGSAMMKDFKLLGVFPPEK